MRQKMVNNIFFVFSIFPFKYKKGEDNSNTKSTDMALIKSVILYFKLGKKVRCWFINVKILRQA